MCGFLASTFPTPIPRSSFRAGLARLSRRGPDGEGIWHEDGVWLGHRRLAIIDLDDRAAQPMHSACGRYTIVFNGEIYNFRALREELEAAGAILRTGSDTEVLVELFAREGEYMLAKLRGMFAFLIWDKRLKSAFAARDPYGIKPLYLAETAAGWMLASQVKALRATGLVSDAGDVHGQAGFLLLGSVPEPHTWYRDIRSVPAGHWCRIDANQNLHGPHRWFDVAECWREAPECNATAAEAQHQVRAAVQESVRKHLVADVPVGVFLSGGIDSGSLAGLMRDAGAHDIQGVTIAFQEFAGSERDEAPVAAQIARLYGIRHHVRTVTRAEFEADLPRILDAMDQPSIDGINTWYAAKATAELGLKVIISGVGGDELFCGYSAFQQIPALVTRYRRIARVPGMRLAAHAAANLQARRSGNARWRWFDRMATSLYGAYWLRRGVFSPDQLPGLMGASAAREWMTSTTPAGLIQELAGELPTDSLAAIGQLESMVYLRNQLLRDSDWASMDHSVELRTPLVDAWLLRDLMPLLRGFGRLHGKALLARSPGLPLPDAIIHRRKTGFGIPIEQWLHRRQHGIVLDSGSRGWARRIADEWGDACA